MSLNAQNLFKRILQGYLQPGAVRVLFLGFSSSIPYIMILGTLSVWLTELGFSKTVVGYFSIVSITYPFKFLFAPYVDRWRIPYFTARMGHRRSWILCAQACVVFGLIVMGCVGPEKHIWAFTVITIFVGLSSAIYDISTEAYRIEIMDRSQISYAASMSGFGYRMGMIASGAGALYLSAFFDSWAVAYFVLALVVAMGMITILFCKEPEVAKKDMLLRNTPPSPLAFLSSARHFLTLPHAWAFFIFLLIHKISASMMMTMTTPFVMDIGFSKMEIANIVKLMGVSMMILGVLSAGFLTNRFGSFLTLRFCIIASMGVSGLFVLMSVIGHNAPLFAICMAVEHFVSGMFSASAIAFMCSYCRMGAAGSDYAFISSFGSLCRVAFSFISGLLADYLGWTGFFTMILMTTLPGLYIINRYKKTFDPIQGQKSS